MASNTDRKKSQSGRSSPILGVGCYWLPLKKKVRRFFSSPMGTIGTILTVAGLLVSIYYGNQSKPDLIFSPYPVRTPIARTA
jgi:hypothetical protein